MNGTNDPRTLGGNASTIAVASNPGGAGGTGFTSNPGALRGGSTGETYALTVVDRVEDEELAALGACIGALVKLDDDQRRRVLDYVRQRFEQDE